MLKSTGEIAAMKTSGGKKDRILGHVHRVAFSFEYKSRIKKCPIN